MSSESSTGKTAEVSRRELPENVEVARMGRPHGIRGETLVELFSDDPRRLASGRRLIVAGRGKELVVAASRPHKGAFLVRFQGIDRREDLEPYRGATLEIRRTEVPPAPADTYYYYELAGCRCHDARAGDLGVVKDLHEDGGGLLLAVDDGQRTLLVPFVKSFLVRVDVEAGRLDVDLPEGLLETCAFES